MNELVEAADERVLSRVVGRYGRLDLLCLDELGYVQVDPRGAELLFQIITEREEGASIAIATNLPFGEWGQACSQTRDSSPPSSTASPLTPTSSKPAPSPTDCAPARRPHEANEPADMATSNVVHAVAMTDESKIATHTDPVGRDRTNFIVKLDLAEHGMPGNFEQCWTHTDDQQLFNGPRRSTNASDGDRYLTTVRSAKITGSYTDPKRAATRSANSLANGKRRRPT